MSNKRIIDLEDSNQLDLNDYLAVYNSEPLADHHTFKRKISDVLSLKSVSVNGKTGNTITITADDISDTVTTKKFVTASEKSKISILRTDLGSNVYLAGDGTYKTQSVYSGSTTVLFVTGSTSISISSNALVLCDSTAAPINIDLPASPVNLQSIRFKDAGGYALTKNIVVNGNGKAIEDPAVYEAILNSNHGAFEIIYVASLNKWSVVSFVF